MPRITTTGVFDTVFNQLGNFTFTLPSAPGTIATTANIATETTRATAAEATNATAITAEATRATAAEALLAPKASPTFTGTVTTPNLTLGSTPVVLGTAIGDVLGPLINFNSSGLPGLKLSDRLLLARNAPALGDFADIQVIRTTTFTGGALTNINAAFRVIGSYGANDATNNWNAVFQAVTVGSAGGLTLGSYSTVRRDPGGTDGIFGSITNAFDNTGLVSSSGKQVVAQEVDIQVQRADDGTNPALFGGVGVRIGSNIVAIRANPADTAQTEVATGLWFTTSSNPPAGASDAHTNFKSAIGFGINTQTQSALDTRGAIAPAGSSNPVAAVTMSAGHVLDFSGGAALTSAPGRYLSYNSGGTKLQYLVSGTERFSVSDAGNALVAGTLGVTGAASAANFIGPVNGTTTNDNAAAGQVGEYVTSQVLRGSGPALTSTVSANITTISLTAGDWDVSGLVGVNGANTTVVSVVSGAVSLISTGFSAVSAPGYAKVFGSFTFEFAAVPTSVARMSLASTTTVYLVVNATFTTSTATGFGFISARRVR